MKKTPPKPIDWLKPLITNDGRKARLLGEITNGNQWNHACAVLQRAQDGHPKGTEVIWMYDASGCYAGVHAGHAYSLKNDSVKRWKWLVMGDDGKGATISEEHLTEDEGKAKYGDQLLMALPATLKEEE